MQGGRQASTQVIKTMTEIGMYHRSLRVPVVVLALLSSSLLIVGVLPSVSIASACGTETYSTRGVVQSIDADRKVIAIAHETIGGYRVKATSSFEARSVDQLKGLGRGDGVRFTFDATTDGRQVLGAIEKEARR